MSLPHEIRPTLAASYPLHITLRVQPAIKTLRDFDIYPAFQKATITAAKFGQSMDDDQWFRIVHLSIQSNHVHLLVEASSSDALSRGMQSFEISAAKWINKAVGKRFKRRRRGSVFADRYHAEPITSPMQTRRFGVRAQQLAQARARSQRDDERVERGSVLVGRVVHRLEGARRARATTLEDSSGLPSAHGPRAANVDVASGVAKARTHTLSRAAEREDVRPLTLHVG